MPGLIKSWSHSRLGDFERCKLAARLKYIDKVPEPIRPLPPGKTEHANDRGTRVHDGCEQYVRGNHDEMPHEADKHFGPQIDFLRVLYGEGVVSLEGEWGMDENWTPTDWKTAWHRCKLDAIVFWAKTHATVIDYKTGKRFGNEVKHGEQMQLYVLNAFLRYPLLEEVTAELWYLDQNEVARITMRRDQGLRFRSNFDRRGRKVTDAIDFPPNPSRFACRWCEYGPWNTGHCKVGVRDGWQPIEIQKKAA
jgi:RecB family exonuclease